MNNCILSGAIKTELKSNLSGKPVLLASLHKHNRPHQGQFLEAQIQQRDSLSLRAGWDEGEVAGHHLAREMPPKVKFHSTKAGPSRQPLWTVLGCLVRSVQNPCVAPTAEVKSWDKCPSKVRIAKILMSGSPVHIPPLSLQVLPSLHPPPPKHICQQLGPRSSLAFSSH